MPTKKILTPIEAGGIYHIFNRGINYGDVFFKDEDYMFFLEKVKMYLVEVAEIYAYVLLPNHYHFLLKVKENMETNKFSKHFRRLILSYTNSINKRDARSGALFLTRFKRLLVENENYLMQLVYYIHHNPEKHDVTKTYKTYKFSSFKSYLSQNSTLLYKNEILDYFGGVENFLDYHDIKHEEESIKKYILE